MSVELLSAKMLLDLGVSVPIRPLRFLKHKYTPRIVLRRPYMGTILKQLNIFLSLGLKIEDLKEYKDEDYMKLMAEHGKEVSRIVAYCITRGYVASKLFNRIVAWWLRWQLHPDVLCELMAMCIMQIDISPFSNIIKLVNGINILAPKLSQKRERS